MTEEEYYLWSNEIPKLVYPCKCCSTAFFTNISILYLHKTHNTPLLPPKICIGIVLDYSWDMFMSQEKLQTMSMQNFFLGGVKKVHYGIVYLCF